MKNKTSKSIAALGSKIILSSLFLLLTGSVFSQNILVDGTSVLVNNQSTFPFWLRANQTLAAGTNVTSISVIEYNLSASSFGGNDLSLEQVVKVTTVQTVPANKIWKVEAVLLDLALTGGNNGSGWIDDGTVVRLVTAADNVGIGTTTPVAKLDVVGQVRITGGAPGAGKVLTSDAAGLANWTTPSSGKVTNVTIRNSCTRVSLGASTSIIMEAFTVNKLSATSTLLIQGSISGQTNVNGAMTQGWKYGTSTEAIGQGLMYEGTASSKTFPTFAVISGYTTTGAQTMTFRFFAANATANSPFGVYNPNATDDARYAQTCSVYTIWEIEP